jgi:hypothetical protein
MIGTAKSLQDKELGKRLLLPDKLTKCKIRQEKLKPALVIVVALAPFPKHVFNESRSERSDKTRNVLGGPVPRGQKEVE